MRTSGNIGKALACLMAAGFCTAAPSLAQSDSQAPVDETEFNADMNGDGVIDTDEVEVGIARLKQNVVQSGMYKLSEYAKVERNPVSEGEALMCVDERLLTALPNLFQSSSVVREMSSSGNFIFTEFSVRDDVYTIAGYDKTAEWRMTGWFKEDSFQHVIDFPDRQVKHTAKRLGPCIEE